MELTPDLPLGPLRIPAEDFEDIVEADFSSPAHQDDNNFLSIGPETSLPVADPITTFEQGFSSEESEGGRIKQAFRRYKTRLILGAAALSLGVTMLADPLKDTKDSIESAAPWVISGLVASEVLFVGGAAMMLAGIGDKIGNPLTVKGRIPELAEKANNSKLFKAGFWTNALGAVGDFVVLTAGVCSTLPVHSWGVVGLTLADLGVTLSVRKALYNGIERNATQDITQMNS